MENPTSKSPPSPRTAWKWTLTKEALAPCLVRDALAMKESGLKDADFFWLGRVPCRSVLIVGIVVGIHVYEKRTVYSVDDSTGVIDCALRHPLSSCQTGAPRGNKNNTNSSRTTSTAAQKYPEPPPPPPPVTEIGYAVKVAGKLMRYHDTRQIMADILEPCDPNLELFHWDHVKVLHETSYSLKDAFVIPALPSHSPSRAYAQPTYSSNRTASHDTRFPAPSSPTGNSTAESASSSVASSPTKTSNVQCAPKLRHPSRLHSRDLTEITFRFYLKHYMDNAPEFLDNGSGNLDDHSDEDVFQATPTKRRSSHTFHGQSLETPRPKHNKFANSTPRPSVQSPSIAISQHSRIHTEARRQEDTDRSSQTYGFTLSYLRRVPELALLASRVVRAEAKRRVRAEREKKAGQTRPSHSRTSSHVKAKQNEPSRLKMKRLFGWALVKLYEEGSIILWDGPVRKFPTGLSRSQDCHGEMSALWKTANSTLFSISSISSSSVLVLDDDEEDAQLSDPEANEESYVPLTPALLAVHVRHALQAMRTRPPGRYSIGGHEPNSEEVATYLRRRDARWARVGAWVVKEAMELVRAEGVH